MNCDQVLIPIACRFVASDQWLTAQFDPTWKISEVKQYILTKVYNRDVTKNDYLLSLDRPVSPITFASAQNPFDSASEGSLEDDPTADFESHPSMEPTSTRQLRMHLTPPQRVASPSASGSPTERQAAALPLHHYSMLAFSTGQLLEDDCSLAWYGLRPHELLELHPPGTIVRLQREVALEYIQPYLELDVRALRVIINDKDLHALRPTYPPDTSSSSPGKIKRSKDGAGESRSPTAAGSRGSSTPQSTRKRRKTKLEWRNRYLVIRRGMLSLFKSRTDLTPVHTCSLALLTTLRGKEDVVHATIAATPSPHVVCAKFRVETCCPSVPEPQPLSSPMADQWDDPWSGGTIPREADCRLWGRRESKEDIKQQRRNTGEGNERSGCNNTPKEDLHEGRTPDIKSESLWYDINIGDATQGTWLILDALDEIAHSNLLRVLHRCSPDTINTTLIPSYLLPDSSFSSPSSPSELLLSHTGHLQRSSCPYPEWRIEVCQRAKRSGLGDVSDAMSWILWGGPPLEPWIHKPGSTGLCKKPSHISTEDSSTLIEPFDFDADDDGGNDSDCELEWESWAKDLTRQALAGLSNNIAVTVTEPASLHPKHRHQRIRPVPSSSTMSSALSEQVTPASASPVGHCLSDFLSGANMGLLSVDSPALLTAPSVLPFQRTGVTTSTVSTGGIVRSRSLISVDGRRGRGVAHAMGVFNEGGGGRFPGKHSAGRPKRTYEENTRGAVASSAPTLSMTVPSANTITTSTVTVQESGTPSPTQSHGSPFAEGSPGAASVSTSASTSVVDAGDGMWETASMMSGVTSTTMTTTTTTTTTTIQLPPRRLSSAGEALSPETSPPSRKQGDKVGKGKSKQVKSPPRGKTFSPERLVSKLDSAFDFVTG
ncbi:hypothetical protein BJV74DRAFT_128505 [Russula compacta]|nr:hypothetical protein BJV74DRAFT_128505 [Russula compacta]